MKPNRSWLHTAFAVLLSILLLSTSLPAIAQTPLPPSATTEPTLTDSSGSQVVPAGPSTGQTAPNVAPAGTEDRDNTDSTSWYILARQSPTDVANTIASGYRPVDIKIDRVSPSYQLTVAYVANSGSYARTGGWFYGLDETGVNNLLSGNNGRLISLKAVDIGAGAMRFTGAYIVNSGADAVGWWWYYNATVAQVNTYLSTNNARLIQVNAYQTGGQTRYAVVMIQNINAFARSWFWYVNATIPNISTYLSANSARLVDLDQDPVTGNYNVIMNVCGSSCPMWWWWVGVDENALVNLSNQYGARIIDVNSRAGCASGTCYDVVFLNISNAITSRVGELLRSTTDGTVGLYLKQVNGPVLANLMDSRPFEPASTIKAVVHLFTMQKLQGGPETLDTQINRYLPPASGSCPINTLNGTESIQYADQEMMWHSDNTRTRELVDHYGVANINSMAAGIGMANTSINHIIGCGGPIPDTTTLDDLGTLYEGVANATLLDTTHRLLFFNQMAGKAEYKAEGYDWTGLWGTDIPTMINQEAPADMSPTVREAYRNMIELAYKAGNYKICAVNCGVGYVDHISIFGYAKIPFCDVGGPREFVFGIYIYNATSDTNSNAAFTLTKAELLREQIHDGMASCDNQLFMKVFLPSVLH